MSRKSCDLEKSPIFLNSAGVICSLGSGLGTVQDNLFSENTEVTYLKPSPKFSTDDNLLLGLVEHPLAAVSIAEEDLTDRDCYKKWQPEELDTIISSNVLEHIEGDVDVLRNFFEILEPGGTCIIIVPAVPQIYTQVDAELGHYRRYTREGLRRLYAETGLRMRHLEFFNMAGVPGWWVTGRVLHRELIPSGSLALYDALVPLFRLERYMPLRVGQSLIAIGERQV